MVKLTKKKISSKSRTNKKTKSSKNARATKINAPTVMNLLELIWLSTSDNKFVKNFFIMYFLSYISYF